VRLPLILAHQGDVLRASPGFRLLFGSTLISGLGTWIAVIALVVDVKTEPARPSGSAPLIADFCRGRDRPPVRPIVDRLSRRFDRRDLTRCAVFVRSSSRSARADRRPRSGRGNRLRLRPSGCLRGPPDLVSEELLPRANSAARRRPADDHGRHVLGGILVAVSGPDLAYWLNAASFAISAVLVVRISASLLQEGKVQSEGHWHDVAEASRRSSGHAR
jgi:hypothetical protein